MTPNYDASATAALQLILDKGITAAPILPLRMLKEMPDVTVITFEDMANLAQLNRDDLVSAFGKNQDAATCCTIVDGKPQYTVVYNQMLPFVLMHRAIARELGHVVMGHNGTRPESVRMEEAKCFARHLLCPRPILKSIQDAGLPLTIEIVGSITGCFEHCIAEMQKTPGAHVPAALNRAVREQFAPYIKNFIRLEHYLIVNDQSSIANFGTYMDNYEE